MALHEALAPLAAPRPSSCCALLGKPGTGLEALEEQGWRLWTGGRPSRSSSTHLSACAGEGFGFWPRCRSCLGDESLPVAFLSREPGGREQKHIPSFFCLSPRHRSPPSCSDCAKIKKKKPSPAAAGKNSECSPQGEQRSQAGLSPTISCTQHLPLAFLTLQLLEQGSSMALCACRAAVSALAGHRVYWLQQ